MESICLEKMSGNLTEAINCQGFTVLPLEKCYPVTYDKREKLMDAKYKNKILNLVKDAYFVHVWNGRTHDKVFSKYSDFAYLKLAEKFCPNVFTSAELYF